MKKRTIKPRGKKRRSEKAPFLLILHRPGSEMSTPLYLIGWALRSVVLFCGIFGLTLFIGDGMKIFGANCPGNILSHAAVCLALTIICSVAAWNSRLRAVAPIGGAVLGIAILFIFTSNPFALIWDGIRSVLNTSMRHMASMGYTSFADNLIGSEVYGGSNTLVLGVGMAILAAIFAVVLSLTLLRRVRTVTAVIVSILVIVPVFTYNLTNGNGGITMVIIFICGEIALLLYERKFSNFEEKRLQKKLRRAEKRSEKKKQKQARREEKEALDRAALRAYAIALELTSDKSSARAAKKSVYRLDKKAKATAVADAKKAAKAEKVRIKKEKKATAAEQRKEKAEKRRQAAQTRAELKALTPEARAARIKADNDKTKEAKRQKAEERRKARRERNERESAVRKTLSASGYAGGFGILLASLAVWLPFALVQGNFATIDFINDPVSVVREYVTAYLQGDDIDLNKLGNVAELTPRTLTYDHPEYKDIQMLAVETDRTSPVYLRGWIGMKFDTASGTWTSATSDDVIEYRNTFSRNFTPDSLKTAFNKYIFPTSMLTDSESIDLRFSKYGFDVQQINLRRINGESLIIYAAPSVRSDTAILGYGSLSPNEARYSHYFDGIYSSRFFKSDVNYSTISFINRLNDVDCGSGMDGMIRYFELFYNYTAIVKDAEALLALENNDGTPRSYRTGRGDVTISAGDLSEIDDLFLAECRSSGIPTLYGDSALRNYILMGSDEREELEEYVETELVYREWADYSYGGSSHSAVVEDVADSILDSLGYTISKRDIGSIPICVDASGNTVPEHNVVMAVIDYLHDGYNYTLEPDEYTGDLTVLDSFLSETKSGYCTHFATAAAMILREYGYSVRYAEGYRVGQFARDYSEDAPAKFRGYALDSDAHAWIEVYFPLVGWISYETVPEYYDDAYGTVGTSDTLNGGTSNLLPPASTDPTIPDDKQDEPEVPADEIDDGTVEAEPIDQIKLFMIVAIAFAATVLVVFIARIIIRRIMRRAENAVADRHAHIVYAMDKKALRSGRIESLKLSREFDDTILRVLRILGYSPRTGEQYSDYAARLEEDFGQLSDYSMPQIFELIAKTEFGEGLSDDELCILADFTDRLVVSAYAGLSAFQKIKWRYLRRMI